MAVRHVQARLRAISFFSPLARILCTAATATTASAPSHAHLLPLHAAAHDTLRTHTPQYYLPAIDDAGVELVAVGLGTVEAATQFAELTSFPLANLYADTTGAAYEAMGFSKGFQPPVKVRAAALAGCCMVVSVMLSPASEAGTQRVQRCSR
jgi:AhpC/TSA antioxidant enzyme